MKDSYYFQHDYNARNDDKILAIRSKYGNEGYAIFFYCLEVMAERGDGYIQANTIGGLSLGYGVAIDWLIGYLNFCVEIGVFEKDNRGYFSTRMIDHINMRKMFIDKGKEGAKKRWNNRGAIRVGNREGNAKERKGKERKYSIFIQPTLKEVQDYIKENNYPINPDKWYNHYSSKGWMIGKNKMKDWKAAVRTWLPDGWNKKKEEKLKPGTVTVL